MYLFEEGVIMKFMYKAIDIALIPAKPLLNYALELNRNLSGSALLLDLDTAVPHLTLAMAVIDDENLLKISKQLEILANKYKTLELTFNGIFKHYSEEHGLVSGLGFERSSKLMSLHKEAMTLVEQYAIKVNENDKSIFAYPHEINYSHAASWVVDFAQKHAYENFDPHITIGMGELKDLPSEEFTFSKIALYHLGKFCSCRDLIAEYKLGP